MKQTISVLLAVTLCLSILFAFTACKSSNAIDSAAPAADGTTKAPAAETTEAPDTEEAPAVGMTGGWTVSEDAPTAELPEDAKAAFDAAMAELVGVEYTPIAYLGTQVVAGTNYGYLCRGTVMSAEPVTNLYVVKVYQDLDGNASVLDIADFSITDYTDVGDVTLAAESLAGGWTVPADLAGTLPEDVQTAFDKAAAADTAMTYTPLAYLGSQVVAGSNYAVLCNVADAADSSVSVLAVAIIYADLDGGAQFTSVTGFEMP